MEKRVAIHRWHNTEENLPILPHFTPLSADAKGSTFGACGIRISGNPNFIDAVLSRLKDLLQAENGSTRLTLSRQSVKPVFDKKWGNADTDAETCYIQIRERTARTKMRKARESSNPLPNLSTPPKKEMAQSSEPKEVLEDEPKKVAHIGVTEDGEVLW